MGKINPGLDIIVGDSRERLIEIPDQSIDCVVTSPPYFKLRNYDHINQIGQEESPEEYINNLTMVFSQVYRVLRDDGTLWLNLGDSYDNKNLMGLPWRVALALKEEGWLLRQDIIWHKKNAMPESVKDRLTKAHEYIFLFTKSRRYFFDSNAIKEKATKGAAGSSFTKGKTSIHQSERSSKKERVEDGRRRKRSVWDIATRPFKGAHFATFPPNLVEPCILAGCRPGGVVLDPFGGVGTTGEVAIRNGRKAVLIELNPCYLKMGGLSHGQD